MDNIQTMMTANEQFNGLETEITRRIKETLSVGWKKERTVGVSFEKHNFQMKIYVDDREYEISVQGRGTDIDKYSEQIIEIIGKEATLAK